MSRYDRQIPVIGEEGQRRLAQSSVAVIGCGGLGNTVATMLAEAGVGRLVLIDPDTPCGSNLNRQFVFRDGDGRPKALALAEWVFDLNPSVKVDVMVSDFRSCDLDCDVVVDCLDSISARLELSDLCFSRDIPLVHAAVGPREGQLATCVPGRTACLRCMLALCRDASGNTPAIGAVVSTIAAMEAWEAIRLIIGEEPASLGHLVTVDMDSFFTDRIRILPEPSCRFCGTTAVIL